MVSSLFTLLIALVVALIILSVAYYAINKSEIPSDQKGIIHLVVLLVVLVVIAVYFFGNGVIAL
jgi:uncharacterized membrane protein